MLQTLDGYFAKMGELLDRGDALVAEKGSAAAVEIANLRGSMSLLISSYQLFVHREVFEPLIAGTDAMLAVRARGLKAECISLSEDFRAYARELAGVDLVPIWPDAAAKAHAMRNRIRRHIVAVRATAPAYLQGYTASADAARNLRSLERTS